MKLFHGTTLKKLLKMLRDGYIGTEETIWDVSEPYTTYFWSEDFLRGEFDEDWFNGGLRYALESADISLATERHKMRRIVLVFEADDLSKIGKLSKDISCGDNQSYSLEFKGKIPINLIEQIYIDSEDKDLYSLYYIGLVHSMIQNRPYYVKGYDKDLDTEVLEASKKVYESLSEWYLDNMDSIESIEETCIGKIKIQYPEWIGVV